MRNVILDYYHSVLGELRKFVLHVLNIILYKTRKVNLLWNSCFCSPGFQAMRLTVCVLCAIICVPDLLRHPPESDFP